MSWLADLLGNLLQVEGVASARRRIWNFVNGPTVTDDAGNKRLTLDWATLRPAEATSSLRGTVPAVGVNRTVAQSNGSAPFWGHLTNLLTLGLAVDTNRDARLYVLHGQTVGAVTVALANLEDGVGGIDVPLDTTLYPAWAHILARRTDGGAEESDAFHKTGTPVVVQNTGGTVAQIGGTTLGFSALGTMGALLATYVVDNTNDRLRIDATGEAGKTVNWMALVCMLKVKG